MHVSEFGFSVIPSYQLTKTEKNYNCISLMRCSFYILDHSMSDFFVLKGENQNGND